MTTSVEHVCATDTTDFPNTVSIPLGQASLREPMALYIVLPQAPLTLPDLQGQRLALLFLVVTPSLEHNFQEILFNERMNG